MTLQIGIDVGGTDRTAVTLDPASIRRAIAAYVAAQLGADFDAQGVALYANPTTGDLGATALSKPTKG